MAAIFALASVLQALEEKNHVSRDAIRHEGQSVFVTLTYHINESQQLMYCGPRSVINLCSFPIS